MLHRVAAAGLQDPVKAENVALHIYIRMVDGVPDPGLGREIHDIIKVIRAEKALQVLPVGTLEETEKARILAALEQVHGNRSRAAQVLGISRRTLYRKLDEYAKEGIQA